MNTGSPNTHLPDLWILLLLLIPVAATCLRSGWRSLGAWLREGASAVDRAFLLGWLVLTALGYPRLGLGFGWAVVSTVVFSGVATSIYLAFSRPARSVAFALFAVITAVDVAALAVFELSVAAGLGARAFRGSLLGAIAAAAWAMIWVIRRAGRVGPRAP